jgi:hypothetical protein
MTYNKNDEKSPRIEINDTGLKKIEKRIVTKVNVRYKHDK